jgi:MFS family permease
MHRPAWFVDNVPWLFAARIVRSFSQAMLVVVVPLFVSAAGYSTLQVGYLLSFAMAGSTGMTLLVGVFSDRFGRKLILSLIALTAAIGSAVFTLTTQFWILSLMAALISVRGGGAGSGGGFGPFYPAEQALIAGSIPDEDRNTVFSSLSLVGVLAGAAGSAVAALPGILQRHFEIGILNSFHPVFWIAASAGLAVFFLTLPIRERTQPSVTRPKTETKISTGNLIARLWLTNGINGFVIGIVGPFLTYWFAVRYGVRSMEIALLYTIANLLTAISYLAAPGVARRLGAVNAIVWTRLTTAVLMAGMALAPTFLLASLAYTVRVMVNSISMPIRQSFVMGVAHEKSRSKVAAIGSLPAQTTAMVAPTIASHLMHSLSEVAPLWMVTAALAINAGLFRFFFKNIRPPEEK